MSKQNDSSKSGLPLDTEYRNSMARIYFLTVRATLVEIYRTLNGNLRWTGPGWQKFVNSIELDHLVHDKLATLSDFSLEKIAFCDPVGELDEAVFPGNVAVLCVPIVAHPRSELVQRLEGPSLGVAADAWGPIGIGQVATRQLIKALMHMFLKNVLKKEFFMMGTQGPLCGVWRINDDLSYERVT